MEEEASSCSDQFDSFVEIYCNDSRLHVVFTGCAIEALVVMFNVYLECTLCRVQY
jgi:hypothetical protein